MQDKESQEQAILNYLTKGGKVTALKALNMFNCLRISARIHNLKNKGHVIRDQFIKTESGKRVKEYFL